MRLRAAPLCNFGGMLCPFQSDWKSDSRGQKGLTFKMFHMSLFQLADMWCDDIDAAEYTSFLETLLNAIAVQTDDGELEFRRMKGTHPVGARVTPHPRPLN